MATNPKIISLLILTLLVFQPLSFVFAQTTVYPSKYYNIDSNGKITKHIFANGIEIATIEGTGSKATIQYLHPDNLGSTNVVTDETGAMVETTDYYPFGSVRIDEKTTSFSEQRKYIGQEYDVDTKLNYLNARYYDSTVGKFLSQDPVFLNPQGQSKEIFNTFLTDPQSQNSYSYAKNNPVTLSDPSGKFIPLVVGAAYMAAPYIITGAGMVGGAVASLFIAHDVGTVAGTAMSNAPASYKNNVYSDIAGDWGGVLSLGTHFSSVGQMLKAKAVQKVELNVKGGSVLVNNVSKTIDIGKQGKHILGDNNFKSTNSILTSDAQSLLDNFHLGNINSSSTINNTKTRVDFGKEIGQFVDTAKQLTIPTTNGIIHNSKYGAHIVPSRPN